MLKRLFFPIMLPLALLCAVAVLIYFSDGKMALQSDADVLHVRIAMPKLPASSTMVIAQDKKFFAENSIDVKPVFTTTGREALSKVLSGQADMAVVADIPFVLAVMAGEDVEIVASIYKSRKGEVLVARRDAGIVELKDLRGKALATTFSTNAQYLADTLLQAENISTDEVRFVNLPPGSISTALTNKSVDAGTIWLPTLDEVLQSLGDQALVFYGNELYAWRFNLVARRSYVEANGLRIQALLKSVDASIAFVHEHPKDALNIASRMLGTSAVITDKSFDPDEFILRLDQSLLLALDEESRWAIRRGFPPTRAVPNYLRYVNTELLGGFRREAVTIIR